DGATDYVWDGLETGLTYKWNPQDKLLSVLGQGAHIGIPRIRNLGDAATDGPAGIIDYTIETASFCEISLNILAGNDLWWHFELERVSYPNPENPNEQLPAPAGSDYCKYGPDGPSDGDTDGGDTGGGNTGGGDTGGTGSTLPAAFTEAFGGTVIGEDGTFTFPAGAEVWGGFANMNTGLYPLSFSEAGSISFKGSVPTGGSVEVRFRLEYKPHPDVEPAYDTATVTVTGAEEATYSVEIPSQGENTFSSLIMYVVTQDVGVIVSEIQVTSDDNDGSSDSGDSGDSGGSGGTAPEVPADNDNNLLSGNWTLAQTGSAAAVGPSLGNTSWWPSDPGAVFEERSCMFDDVYSFNDDTNSFSKDIQDATWIDPWQGADAASCNMPVAPYDGSVASSYAYDADAGTLTLYGKGAHIGLGMVANGAEIGDIADAPDSITYQVTELTNSSMTLDIAVVTSDGTDAFWRFKLVCADDSCIGNNDEGNTAVGEVGGVADFSGAFGGFVANTETNEFEFPSEIPVGNVEDWAGVANVNTDLYPIVLPNNTQINFLASSAEPVTIRFRFEYNPYPDIDPAYDTGTAVINGPCQAYSIDVAAQGANTFSSYLMYIVERDIPVTVSNVVIGGDAPTCPDAAPVAPVITSDERVNIDENIGENQVVYTVTSDNPDATYMISAGDAEFSIEASTGEITLSTNPDYENIDGYTFNVKATANNLDSEEQTVTLTINNLDEASPEITSGALANSVSSNSTAGQVVYNATAEDSSDDIKDAGAMIFSLTEESDSALSINASTGVVTLADNPDYNTQSEYSFGVIATDGAGNASAAQAVTLAVNNPSVSPLIIEETSSQAGYTFVTVSCDSVDNCQAPDVDGLTNYQSVFVSSSTMNGNEKVVTISYSSDDETTTGVGVKVFFDSSEMSPSGVKDIYTDDNSDLIASPAIGSKEDKDNEDGNPETDRYYLAGWASLFGNFPGSTTVDLFTLCFNGTDNENCDAVADETAPEFTSSADAGSIEENSGAGQAIYTAVATDESNITYSLSGADAAEFSIDPATGVVTLTADPVFATKASYSFDVVATDDSDNVSQQTVSLVVTEAVPAGPAVVISAPSQAPETQHVYVSAGSLSEDGEQLSVTIGYLSDDTTTTGLGLRIHFDSSALSAPASTNILTNDLFIDGKIDNDVEDFDGDASTDQYINFSWASMFGQWPGSASVDLATITFDIVEGISGSSTINLTSSSNAAGFAFDGQNQEINLP
ncbi:MAG: cadherin domain-containing protein, partial [Porticoccaceae bacterium]